LTIVGCDGLPYNIGKLLYKNEQLHNRLLVPGNGHIEMNATKAVFKLLWDVVIEDLVKINGFRTPLALLAAKNCSDHHKAWEFMNILLFGTLDELLRTFILHCFKNDNPVNVSEFYKFIENSKSPPIHGKLFVKLYICTLCIYM
jgi:hypothetical protein